METPQPVKMVKAQSTRMMRTERTLRTAGELPANANRCVSTP